ncbi:aminotransferase class IV [Microbacterium murale]|uniref:4-amino-4-deoxychorismate lyase n=1 Tax=Microbacterium murale TaxID=1081040 RepID=A0ABU0PBZ6_9MICO|nr:aminotransferase class IV [Microbacterium murale]MDQ0644124.1 4-amino-4-deoxychorismate lyase [Microbacterium murale]
MKPLVLYRVDLRAGDPASALERLDPAAPLLTGTDLAATRGDGVFETVVLVDGVPQAMEAHLDRFERSASLLELPSPDRVLWRTVVERVAAEMDVSRGAVKYILSRGDEATGEPTGWALGFAPTRHRTGVPPELDVVLLDRGYRSDVATTAPWLLQGAKTLSYAVNMAALREAGRRGASDVIFVSSDGYILEGPNSTVIARIDGEYVTPPVEFGILPGTTQADAFEALREGGDRVAVRALTVSDLSDADALWLCSSTRGAAPVRSLDGVAQHVDHATTERISAFLNARKG